MTASDTGRVRRAIAAVGAELTVEVGDVLSLRDVDDRRAEVRTATGGHFIAYMSSRHADARLIVEEVEGV